MQTADLYKEVSMQNAQGRTEPVHQFLQENEANLRRIATLYVIRSGLARYESVQTIAEEVLQDAVLEALAHSERFASAQQPFAWFMGVLVNVIKRKRVSVAKRARFEVSLNALQPFPDTDNAARDDLLLSQQPGLEQLVETREQLREVMALIPTKDAEMMQMALVQGFQADKLGEALGVTQNAARVRLHRALSRLRKVWKQQRENDYE